MKMKERTIDVMVNSTDDICVYTALKKRDLKFEKHYPEYQDQVVRYIFWVEDNVMEEIKSELDLCLIRETYNFRLLCEKDGE